LTHPEADFIVVGAGTSDSVVARRLVERTDAAALLLESGPSYPACILDVPMAGLSFEAEMVIVAAICSASEFVGTFDLVSDGTRCRRQFIGECDECDDQRSWNAASLPSTMHPRATILSS